MFLKYNYGNAVTYLVPSVLLYHFNSCSVTCISGVTSVCLKCVCFGYGQLVPFCFVPQHYSTHKK
jgi:hypothetical protein